MQKVAIAATLLIALVSPSRADLTFAQWASGPPDKRAIYTAGVMETVGVYAEVLGFVDRWTKCLETIGLTYGAVADGALELVNKNPQLNKEPAPAVLIAYMNERCGFTVLQK